jgi:hypothetical protein
VVKSSPEERFNIGLSPWCKKASHPPSSLHSWTFLACDHRRMTLDLSNSDVCKCLAQEAFPPMEFLLLQRLVMVPEMPAVEMLPRTTTRIRTMPQTRPSSVFLTVRCSISLQTRCRRSTVDKGGNQTFERGTISCKRDFADDQAFS